MMIPKQRVELTVSVLLEVLSYKKELAEKYALEDLDDIMEAHNSLDDAISLQGDLVGYEVLESNVTQLLEKKNA